MNLDPIHLTIQKYLKENGKNLALIYLKKINIEKIRDTVHLYLYYISIILPLTQKKQYTPLVSLSTYQDEIEILNVPKIVAISLNVIIVS